MSPGGPGDVAGFVLAGGQSSRMGSDKALVELAGLPLIARALHILRNAHVPAAIAGARSDLSSFAPVIPDSSPDQGPLSGICSALSGIKAEWAVFVSVDLPLLPPELIAVLLNRARQTGNTATLVSVNGHPQTFPVVLRSDALPVLKAEWKAGKSGCFAAFTGAASHRAQRVDVVPLELLVQTGQIDPPDRFPPVRWFQNVNTAADLKLAGFYLADRDRVI